jgi:hypothetical protein
MWRSATFASIGMLAAAAFACSSGGQEKCDLGAEYATRNTGPVPVISLEEARRRADFEIALPADLPEGVAVDGVTLVGPPCSDSIRHVQVLIKGPDWAFTIDEIVGDRPQPLASSTPARINGVIGELHRQASAAG